jgi:hypothetical protein
MHAGLGSEKVENMMAATFFDLETFTDLKKKTPR